MFKLNFAGGWDKYFSKMDKSERERVWKKIQKIKTIQTARHLMHGLQFFVVEAGQYRICFKEKQEARIIIFIGNHKEYEKWYKKQ